jgi:putative hydrolase of the HAD superfamily
MSAAIPDHVRAVFFDAVGTLLLPDPPAASVYTAAANRFGLQLDAAEVRNRFLAAYRIEELRDRSIGWRTNEQREVERWRRIVAAALPGIEEFEACFREVFEHFGLPSSWRLDPGAADAIGELARKGMILGIGSNYDARLHSVLAGFPELDALAERVVVSADVGWRKPSEKFFEEVIRAAGRPANEIAFVGDDIGNDYLGSTGSGMRGVLLDPASQAPESIVRVRAFRDLLA